MGLWHQVVKGHTGVIQTKFNCLTVLGGGLEGRVLLGGGVATGTPAMESLWLTLKRCVVANCQQPCDIGLPVEVAKPRQGLTQCLEHVCGQLAPTSILSEICPFASVCAFVHLFLCKSLSTPHASVCLGLGVCMGSGQDGFVLQPHRSHAEPENEGNYPLNRQTSQRSAPVRPLGSIQRLRRKDSG